MAANGELIDREGSFWTIPKVGRPSRRLTLRDLAVIELKHQDWKRRVEEHAEFYAGWDDPLDRFEMRHSVGHALALLYGDL